MQKTKIEWTDYTWNPIKGICPVGCRYCYARRMYQRFKWNPKIRFELRDPMAIDRLHRKNVPDGSKVFVCSTFELFHPKVPKSWRKDIFSVIKHNPRIIFQILTKFPLNIDRPMPDNVWLGVTITNHYDWEKWPILHTKKKAKLKFISFEPLLGSIHLSNKPDWIIVGRMTGHGKKYDPSRIEVGDIVKHYEKLGTPIFLKNNLKEIWREPLIQEFPRVG